MQMDSHAQAEHGQAAISVQVRYLGANRQYVDPQAPATETAATLKSKALRFFGLVDGSGQPGGKVYTLSKGTVPVTDLNLSLQQLADGKHELKLDLLEQLEQG
jgi:hypothetical protein